jgi:hypothetical protein
METRKLILLFIFVFIFQNVEAQTDYEWSVGLTYKPFLFTLQNKADDADGKFEKVDEFKKAGDYFGLTGSYHFYNRIYLTGGLGYSNQTFNYKYASVFHNDEILGYGNWLNLNLKYLHIPLQVGYQLPANYLENMGVRLYGGTTISYNLSYSWESIFYYVEPFTSNIDFDKIYSRSTRTSTERRSIIYDSEGAEKSRSEGEITYPINRLNIGLQAGLDFYFIISEMANLNFGIWYNYDLLRTEAKNETTMINGERPDNSYSHNQRIGLSIGLEVLIF